jgi:hypothetical protein
MNTDLTTHDPAANGPPLSPAISQTELAQWYAEREEWFAELEAIRATWSDRPYPDQAEITADWNWIRDRINAFEVGTGQKQYAAVYRKQVIGLDTDALRLELALARKHPDIHPDRFVIVYVG